MVLFVVYTPTKFKVKCQGHQIPTDECKLKFAGRFACRVGRRGLIYLCYVRRAIEQLWLIDSITASQD